MKNVTLIESVIHEFAEFCFQKYVDLIGSSPERAKGYVKLFKYILEYLSNNEVISNSVEDYMKAMDLSIDRSIDITDALLVVTAMKLKNAVVLTRDKDFERVKDLVKVTDKIQI
ncbi:type II toxin-antitoxin system VapC family toxin [Sulfurisphaera ohwakuensis]|uniref:type II toxin-antitoxin system VapC family toxin n=1 Tax=Sulfurisphaera ohwakuensis TaxID=69656 RepID=UPI001C85619A